ncbi:MAG: endolytic transglycosylase MltG [Bacteriovoracaceae bacterium]|nr:endolytic transglycosylase MltG [Bacteriovoracaceae bacterium]
MKKLVYFLILPPIIGLLLSGMHIYYLMTKGVPTQNTFFQIKTGDTFAQINYRLYKDNLISNPRLFHYYSKFKNSLTKFKAGTYEIQKGANLLDVHEALISGLPVLLSITIPEGKNLYEISEILAAKGFVKNASDFVQAAKSEKILKKYNLTGDSTEGYLYPETYRFAPETPAELIVSTMVEQFKRATKSLTLAYPNLNPHQIITLASIVEKETGATFERRTIAGIYHNRLKKKMRLQADPTTIYGIYHRDGKFNGNLRKKDLLEATSYNTYKILGLPLGPICNPSRAAIEATLDPEPHNYLYFVSKNDGTHVFTATYKEHNQAVDTWQRTRSNRAGKSWKDLNQTKQ